MKLYEVPAGAMFLFEGKRYVKYAQPETVRIHCEDDEGTQHRFEAWVDVEIIYGE